MAGDRAVVSKWFASGRRVGETVALELVFAGVLGETRRGSSGKRKGKSKRGKLGP